MQGIVFKISGAFIALLIGCLVARNASLKHLLYIYVQNSFLINKWLNIYLKNTVSIAYFVPSQC